MIFARIVVTLAGLAAIAWVLWYFLMLPLSGRRPDRGGTAP